MIMTKEKLAVIHLAKKQLGLSDEAYRQMLSELAGVESAKDLGEHGFEAVMFRFYRMGFQSTWNKRNLGYRRATASPRQVAMIKTLWHQFTEGQGDEASLGKWLEGKFKVSSVRFLDAKTAHKACGALKRMTDKRKAAT